MTADEIVISPAEVYAAPVGTAFPDVDEVPGVAWHLIGKLGSKNQTEDGVTVRRVMEASDFRAAGTTLIRKSAITQAGYQVEFSIADILPEEMLLALGGDPDDIVDTPAASGVAGTQKFALPTSPVPIQRALLIRYPSPFGADLVAQTQIQTAIQKGGGESTFNKSDPAMNQHLWEVIEPDSGEAVEYVYQDAVALA